ncbi:MAG: nucleoside kinase [Halanaerobiales bacterium]
MKINVGEIYYEVEDGKSIDEILSFIEYEDYDITVAAIINNQIYRLTHKPESGDKIKPLTLDSELGNRIYRRSLFMLLAKSVYSLYNECRLSIEHSLSNGIYCELHRDCPLTRNELKKIESKMQDFIEADIPINKKSFPCDEVKNIIEKQGFQEKADNFKFIEKKECILYEIDGYYDYFYHEMVPSTGYLKKFDLHYRMPGFVLLFPRKENPEEVPNFIHQPKLANVFLEYENLGDILGVGNVSELNSHIKKGDSNKLIHIAEGLHEKNIAKIADKISDNIDKNQIILIAGPSSSGKTTFSHRLSIQLQINGLNPVTISTDDYFVNREDTPLDEDGNYDFEALAAIDLELFNAHLLDLLQGKRVEIPTFNFEKGKREYHGNYLKLNSNQPLLIEGIHGLNDKLTNVVPSNRKFKIYVSALTQLNLDRHNRLPTSDTRLLRRIIRDNFYRGHDASETLKWWPKVRKGEEKNIFPFQENADVMFNSALIYELAVLKNYALDLLREIPPEAEGYLEAKRLIEVLHCVQSMSDENVPNTSILKEFIGGSAFREN